MSELDKKIRDYYSAQSLPSATVDAILNQGQAEARQNPSRPSVSKFWVPIAACAAILIAASLWGLAQIQETVNRQRHEVAEQVSFSHRLHQNPEEFQFAVDDFGHLQMQMNRLDFSLLPAEEEIRERFEVTAARYCSIGGHVACHFKVRDRDSGRVGSLYVAVLDPALQKVSPGRCEASEVECEMWNDGARFFCFASQPPRNGVPAVSTGA